MNQEEIYQEKEEFIDKVESVTQKLQYDSKRDEEVVQFFIEDALDYIEACDCSQ